MRVRIPVLRGERGGTMGRGLERAGILDPIYNNRGQVRHDPRAIRSRPVGRVYTWSRDSLFLNQNRRDSRSLARGERPPWGEDAGVNFREILSLA